MTPPPENENSRPGEKFDAFFDRHWLAVLLRVIAIGSLIYALTGFSNDLSELESEGRFVYGFSSALTLVVFAQILAYLQDLVRYAKLRASKEN